MYGSLLSALLLGLFSSVEGISPDAAALEKVSVAPPSEHIVVTEHLSASGVVILDRQSGQRLFARDARSQRPIASLTKLMTALLIVQSHDMDEMVTIPQSVVDVVGNKAYLPPGERFTVGDLLSALLIHSANDAAVTLAIYHSGSLEAFVEEMNRRALQLGMTGTSFRNPAGLDHPAQWSTPQDIAWLTLFSLRQPEIAKRMGTSGARISSTKGESIHLYHTHALLHEQSPVFAGKTGTTTGAGQCLMSVVGTPDHEYIVVLLGSNQRYRDMQIILSALDTASSTAPVARR